MAGTNVLERAIKVLSAISTRAILLSSILVVPGRTKFRLKRQPS